MLLGRGGTKAKELGKAEVEGAVVGLVTLPSQLTQHTRTLLFLPSLFSPLAPIIFHFLAVLVHCLSIITPCPRSMDFV